MTPGQIALRALIVGFIVSFAVITGFAYTTLLERKVLARLQHRIGPNRAGYIPLPWRRRREALPERLHAARGRCGEAVLQGRHDTGQGRQHYL
jgi:hypothetical protein